MEKNKELTPMMELIEGLEKVSKIETNPLITKTIKLIIDIANELLPKEKQVIEEVKEMYKECFELFIPTEKWDEATLFLSTYDSGIAKGLHRKETYYNTKYNNQIK